MARRRGLEFGVFDQTPRKWARRLGPSGLAIRLYRRLCKKQNPNVGSALWASPRLSSVANAPGPNFSPPRRPPRSLGRAALDSDHAECPGSSYIFQVS